MLFAVGAFITLAAYLAFEKLYNTLESMLKRITTLIKKKLETRGERNALQGSIDLTLSVETLLYTILLSFYLSLFITGLFLGMPRAELLAPPTVYFILALLTAGIRKRPWSNGGRFLKLGILLVNPLIIAQGYLVASKAILAAMHLNGIADATGKVLESMEARLPETFARDLLALMFFLGLYQVPRYIEAGGETKTVEKWDVAIVGSALKAVLILPVVVFAVLLSFDFISVFHDIPRIRSIPPDTVAAIFSGIVVTIIEFLKESRQVKN